jgi:hypothetical protein
MHCLGIQSFLLQKKKQKTLKKMKTKLWLALYCARISEDPNLSPLFEAAAAASDAEYGAVRKALLEGRLPKTLPPTHPARAYSSVWPDLSLYDDGLIILDGRRIVIPDSQRSSVLELLHLPHNGQTKTKEAARQLYYWRTMNNARSVGITCQAWQVNHSSKPKQVDQ